ncbi:MAG: hypothetical protein GYA16_06360 [Spirochaetes bacterium]|nr:hypothetical protein [Spirochaetota bacterium]
MGMHLSADVYDIFEDVFKGKEKAKKVMSALEEVIVTTVHDSWYRTKEELKMEVFSHYATKQDLGELRKELLGKFDIVYEKTEKDKAELLGIINQNKEELLGIMKQDKAELLGIINQNKEELLGIMKQDKAELTGKIDALYEKTEKDKAELIGMMKQDKAELTGKIDALYQKTEKDKAELTLRIERLDKKFSIYFAVLLFAIIFLNQNALEFIAKMIGIIR